MKPRQHTSSLISSLIDEITELDYQKTRNKMLLSANIDSLLKKHKLPKTEFARRLNKRPSEVSRWLSGTVNITIDTQTEIAFFFDVPVHTLTLPLAEVESIELRKASRADKR